MKNFRKLLVIAYWIITVTAFQLGTGLKRSLELTREDGGPSTLSFIKIVVLYTSIERSQSATAFVREHRRKYACACKTSMFYSLVTACQGTCICNSWLTLVSTISRNISATKNTLMPPRGVRRQDGQHISKRRTKSFS